MGALIRGSATLGGAGLILPSPVSTAAAPALQVVNKNAGTNGSWDGAAWAPGLATTGDFTLVMELLAPTECCPGVATGARSFPAQVPSYGQTKYGFLRYGGTGQTYQNLDGVFSGAQPNLGGTGHVWTVMRSGTNVLIKEDGVTKYTIGSVDPSIPCYPFMALNYSGLQNVTATWNGVAFTWTDLYNAVAQ